MNRAITLASSLRDDDFAHINPLIMIMQWWQANVPEAERATGSAEARLADACKRFIAANGPR